MEQNNHINYVGIKANSLKKPKSFIGLFLTGNLKTMLENIQLFQS